MTYRCRFEKGRAVRRLARDPDRAWLAVLKNEPARPSNTSSGERGGRSSSRPPVRPAWQIFLIAATGFALPFLVVVWFGVGSNSLAEAEWHATWEELHGIAIGPVIEGEDWDRLPVRYERRDGTTVEEPVVITPLQPQRPDADSARSAQAGDTVPLLRDIDLEHQVVVSPHFLADPMWPFVAFGAALGALNGGLLALVYRRRHRM